MNTNLYQNFSFVLFLPECNKSVFWYEICPSGSETLLILFLYLFLFCSHILAAVLFSLQLLDVMCQCSEAVLTLGKNHVSRLVDKNAADTPFGWVMYLLLTSVNLWPNYGAEWLTGWMVSDLLLIPCLLNSVTELCLIGLWVVPKLWYWLWLAFDCLSDWVIELLLNSPSQWL
jgi:hypothetical protein